MKTDVVRRLSVVILPLVVPFALAGCTLFGFGGASAEVGASTTCADWRAMGVEARVALADRLVGRSAVVLERVRERQHEAAATSRETLVREVEGSLTKNCDVMAPGNPFVLVLFTRLYLAEADSAPNAVGAPTPDSAH